MTLYPRDAEIKTALSHEQAVAMTIRAEAVTEPIEGEIAVGCVIRNRLLHPVRFGQTWRDVCHAKAQFSCWQPVDGEKNYLALMAYCEQALAGTRPWPPQQLWIAQGIISGAITEDRVNGATHYYAKYMKIPPKWARGVTPVADIGTHLFFKGV
jgi:N-acetylmuramoyl-L-alanine amidase